MEILSTTTEGATIAEDDAIRVVAVRWGALLDVQRFPTTCDGDATAGAKTSCPGGNHLVSVGSGTNAAGGVAWSCP